MNRKYFLLCVSLMFLCCAASVNKEESIRKDLMNFNSGDNIQKIILYFTQNNIEYELYENINITDFSSNQDIHNQFDIDDKILFSMYYTEKNNNIVIKETYYLVYFIFDKGNLLKNILFDKKYLGI